MLFVHWYACCCVSLCVGSLEERAGSLYLIVWLLSKLFEVEERVNVYKRLCESEYNLDGGLFCSG